jgi:hypothetical protein
VLLLGGGAKSFLGAVVEREGALRGIVREVEDEMLRDGWGREAEVVGLDTSGTEKASVRWGRVGCLVGVFKFGSVGCRFGVNVSFERFGRVGCLVGVDIPILGRVGCLVGVDIPRFGKVGCLATVAKESFRDNDEIFVSVLAKPREFDVSALERFESIVIPVFVLGKYLPPLVEEVSILDNNPLLDSLESALDKGYKGIEITLAPSPSNSTLGNVGRTPTSKLPTSTSYFFFSGFGSYRFRRRSANMCEIRLSTL